MTSTKVLLVILVFIFALVFVAHDSESSKTASQNLSPSTSFNGSNNFFKFGSSLVACLWSFDGFADGNYLLEELLHPIRDLPRIILVGMTTVTLCYLLINIGYLSVLDKQTIMDSKAIAVQFGDTVSDTLFHKGKNVLALLLALGVSMSTAGAINGSIMTGGRGFFAVARGGKAPSIMARLNSRGAPWAALLAQGSWSLLLLLLPGSNFASLLDYFGPASWMYYAFSASALIKLRYSEPDTLRPFRVPLYPFPPLLVIGIASFVMISSLITQPLYTSLALGFIVLAFPVHIIMERNGWVGENEEGQTPSATHSIESGENALHEKLRHEVDGAF